jgi:hypothetical protein
MSVTSDKITGFWEEAKAFAGDEAALGELAKKCAAFANTLNPDVLTRDEILLYDQMEKQMARLSYEIYGGNTILSETYFITETTRRIDRYCVWLADAVAAALAADGIRVDVDDGDPGATHSDPDEPRTSEQMEFLQRFSMV